MSDKIAMQCLEAARNLRMCAGMDAAMGRIAELEEQLDAAKRFARAVWMGEGSLDEDFIKYIERTALGGGEK